MADIKKIRQIYDQVEIHVRGLQAEGGGFGSVWHTAHPHYDGKNTRRSTPYTQPSILWRQLEFR